jgi:hypothetical protein
MWHVVHPFDGTRIEVGTDASFVVTSQQTGRPDKPSTRSIRRKDFETKTENNRPRLTGLIEVSARIPNSGCFFINFRRALFLSPHRLTGFFRSVTFSHFRNTKEIG